MRALVLTIAMLAVGGVARAENKEAARHAFHEANLQFEIGDFASALESFKRAYVSYEDPAFLYNIALCERLLGDKAQALHSYRAFLRRDPGSPYAAQVDRIVADLQASLDADETAGPPAGNPNPTVEAPHVSGTQLTASLSPLPRTVVQVAEAEPPAPIATPSPREKPIYKRAWFWGVLAGATVVVGVGVGLGVGLGGNAKNQSYGPVAAY